MKRSNSLVAAASGAVILGMLGLGFAADPLYKTFCKVTGYGGTTRIATAAPTGIADKDITVRFDANVADTALVFRPLQATETVKVGQHGLAFFEVTNPTDKEIRVIAAYNVTPHFAGEYFYKLECFCFDERIIEAGESKKLPVVYYVSPDILDDHVARDIETITLSYTFYESSHYSGPKKQAGTGAANSAGPG